MAHIAHLLSDEPWGDSSIPLTTAQDAHLRKVLRMSPGQSVSYTDGAGVRGSGIWTGEGVERGDETTEPEPPHTTIAVAPPKSKERQRWLVEKLTELGVWRVRWLVTVNGQGRPPRPERAEAWMVGAVEQSRRVWRTNVDHDWSDLVDLGSFVAADRGGPRFDGRPGSTIAVGPEGGWAPGELPDSVEIVGLSPHVLRTETAAVAAAILSTT